MKEALISFLHFNPALAIFYFKNHELLIYIKLQLVKYYITNMKKLFLILLFIPLFSISQDDSNKKNGLQNLLKQAEKIVGNIDFNKK